MEAKNPLVTVAVATYNSSRTVCATLESIKRQTYPYIELIISDDASTDDTVEVCNEWLIKNKDRFVGTNIITVTNNTGVAANSNRIVQSINGVYYKGIAGDDCLLDDCIEKNVKYIEGKPEVAVLFSKCYLFCNKNNQNVRIGEMPSQYGIDMLAMPAEQQKIVLYYGLFIPTPTFFMRTSLFDKFRYDERYDAFEDLPFFTKLTEHGIKLYYMDEYTVMYRIEDSVSHPSVKLENERMWISYNKYFYDNTLDKIKHAYPEIYRYKKARIMLADFRLYVLNNKNTKINHLLSFLFGQFLKKSLSIDERDIINLVRKYTHGNIEK